MKELRFFLNSLNFSIFLIYPLKMFEIIREEYHNYDLKENKHQNLQTQYFRWAYKFYFKEALTHP